MTSLVTVAVLVIMPLQTLGHDIHSDRSHALKTCGSLLADRVAQVCDGAYNIGGKENKRTETRYQYDDLEPEYFYNYEAFVDTDAQNPFRSKRSVSIMKPFRSKRQLESSIVHECCMKPCTVDELLGYCSPN